MASSNSCENCVKSFETQQLMWFIHGLNSDLKYQLLRCPNIQSIQGAKLKAKELQESVKIEIDPTSNQDKVWNLLKDKLLLTQNESESPVDFSSRVESIVMNLESLINKCQCQQCHQRNEIEVLTWFINGLNATNLKTSIISKITQNPEILNKQLLVPFVNQLWNELNSSDDYTSRSKKRKYNDDDDDKSDSSSSSSITAKNSQEIKVENLDQQLFSSLDWIKRKREMIMYEDESPRNFSLRVENLVLSAHHELKKVTKEPDSAKCQTCFKRNEIECLQLFINGIDIEFQDALETRLELVKVQTVSEAVLIANELFKNDIKQEESFEYQNYESEDQMDPDYKQEVNESDDNHEAVNEDEDDEEEEEEEGEDFKKVKSKKVKLKRNVKKESPKKEKFKYKTASNQEELIMFEGHEYERLEAPMDEIARLNQSDFDKVWTELQNEYPSGTPRIDKSGKESKTYDCPLCTHKSVSFKFNSDRLKHIFRSHKKLKRFMCLKCNAFGALSVDSVIKHISVVHQNQKKFKCDICETSFSTKHGRDSHISIVHNKEKNSQCETCGKSFISDSSLTVHVRTVHLKIKNAMCNICGKQFYDKQFLKRHMHISHLKTKADCPYCGATFAKGSLNSHIKSIHSGRDPVKCQHCNSTYRHFSSLRKHMKKNHPEHKI